MRLEAVIKRIERKKKWKERKKRLLARSDCLQNCCRDRWSERELDKGLFYL